MISALTNILALAHGACSQRFSLSHSRRNVTESKAAACLVNSGSSGLTLVNSGSGLTHKHSPKQKFRKIFLVPAFHTACKV